MTSAALPPISQDFARPSLSDTRRPATSAGIIQLSGAALPGTNTLGGQGMHNNGQFASNPYNALNASSMMGMRLATGNKPLQGSSMSNFDPSRRASLSLAAIDENAPSPDGKPPMTTQNAVYRLPTGGGGGPPGSSGGMSNHGNTLRRESDANYVGVFAHTVEDANVSPEHGKRDPTSGPSFNNPFPSNVLDPALLQGPGPGSSHGRPTSQHQQGMRFPSAAESAQNNLDYYSPANAWRRASEPHYKHAQGGYVSLPNASALYPNGGMNGYPATAAANNGLSMRELHIGGQDRLDDTPATAPVYGSLNQPSPTSAASFASAPNARSSYPGGYNGYPAASHMQQWQYGFPQGQNPNQQQQNQSQQSQQQLQQQQQQQAQRRRSTQGATTGYYPANSAQGVNEVSRRPSVIDVSHAAYGHEARHSIGVPPSGAQQWNGFPIDYRFGDVPPQHRSMIPGTSNQIGGAMPSAHLVGGFGMGAYPDPNGNFTQPYDDVRNNSYSTASTQSRHSFEARMSDSHASDALRRDSSASSGDGGYSGGDGTHDPASGPMVKKRPRRRFDQIERLYLCRWEGCEKAYGTLNHLNAHVSMQKHGIKRKPEGELRPTLPVCRYRC